MRLFVAVDLTDPARERVWRASAPLREESFPVKWVDRERLHLTLKFLGEVDGGRQPELSGALERAVAGFAPLELRLGGVGAFPSLGQPRVLWVGVDGPPDLVALRDAVEEAAAGLGFERESRAFHAHVTLGRARRGASRRAFEGLAEAAEAVELDEACRVEGVELMESVLRPQGARYSVVSSHALEGG